VFNFHNDLPGREIRYTDTRQRVIVFRYASRRNRIANVFKTSLTHRPYADFKGWGLNLSVTVVITEALNRRSKVRHGFLRISFNQSESRSVRQWGRPARYRKRRLQTRIT
jgi:hypothetical protein